MKKRGFTLIELLAVIVALAIIAIIATPIVMNTITEVKIGVAKRTAENYIKQVETSLALTRMDGSKISDGIYIINKDGNLERNGKTLTIEMSGIKPSSGYIVIENKEINKISSKMKINNYNVIYDKEKQSYEIGEVLCEAVTELSIQKYYDKNTSSVIEEKTGVLVTNGNPYAYGVEYTCELGDNDAKTFYVLEENEDTVSLIMSENIDANGLGTSKGSTVQWCSHDDYISGGGQIQEEGATYSNTDVGPITALNYLKNSTKSWTKLEEEQISIPTGQQIANASLNTSWDSTKGFYSPLPTWLYENLYTNNALPYGYWTTTPYPLTTYYVWHGYYTGYLEGSVGADNGSLGLRPVITISKSQLG